jgi:hypothetical protein
MYFSSIFPILVAMQTGHTTMQNAIPGRRKNYWGDKLSEKGRDVVEELRKLYIRGYGEYTKDGYRAVDDIPETRRGVFLDLNDSQIRMTLEAAARSRISKLEGEDRGRGKAQTYDRFIGAIRPRRGVKWKDIQHEDDLRWHPQGVTIVAKETRNSFFMSPIKEIVQIPAFTGVDGAPWFS